MERVAVVLFVLVLVANSLFLTTVPGLLGDEASEGMNVFELLRADHVTLTGERSYIGPLADYVRVPFVGAFGYSVAALRLPMLFVTAVLFWLVLFVAERLFGASVAPWAATAFFFSPVYVLYQRLGWAITLLPFFSFLLLAVLLASHHRHRQLVAGLIAGLGLHAHLLFLPTLLAVVVMWLLTHLRHPSRFLAWWPALVGCMAGFGTQLVVLQLKTEDQGDPGAVAASVWERLGDLPEVLRGVISGSLFKAQYSGEPFSDVAVWVSISILTALLIAAFVFSEKRSVVFAWLAGLVVHTSVLVVMVDRFTLRYFVVVALGVWFLAGVGLGSLLQKLTFLKYQTWLPVGVASMLFAFTFMEVWYPFLYSGGATSEFYIGKRHEAAAAFVATHELQRCLEGAGRVVGSTVHIANRLEYLALTLPGLIPVRSRRDAQWVVSYTQADKATFGETRCPNLLHWQIEKL